MVRDEFDAFSTLLYCLLEFKFCLKIFFQPVL